MIVFLLIYCIVAYIGMLIGIICLAKKTNTNMLNETLGDVLRVVGIFLISPITFPELVMAMFLGWMYERSMRKTFSDLRKKDSL